MRVTCAPEWSQLVSQRARYRQTGPIDDRCSASVSFFQLGRQTGSYGSLRCRVPTADVSSGRPANGEQSGLCGAVM